MWEIQRQERRHDHKSCPRLHHRKPQFRGLVRHKLVEGLTLPDACAVTCSASVSVQRISVKAAMTGDVDPLKQTVLHDPPVGAIWRPKEVWQVVDETLVAQAQWMTQYAEAISAAR